LGWGRNNKSTPALLCKRRESAPSFSFDCGTIVNSFTAYCLWQWQRSGLKGMLGEIFICNFVINLHFITNLCNCSRFSYLLKIFFDLKKVIFNSFNQMLWRKSKF
jgi:hypothetical protein